MHGNAQMLTGHPQLIQEPDKAGVAQSIILKQRACSEQDARAGASGADRWQAAGCAAEHVVVEAMSGQPQDLFFVRSEAEAREWVAAHSRTTLP
jgi:hypothetical protein